MRLSVDISQEEHMYLKICCAKLNLTIKDFCADAIREKIKEWEDKWSMEKNKHELEVLRKSESCLSIEDLEKELGLKEN